MLCEIEIHSEKFDPCPKTVNQQQTETVMLLLIDLGLFLLFDPSSGMSNFWALFGSREFHVMTFSPVLVTIVTKAKKKLWKNMNTYICDCIGSFHGNSLHKILLKYTQL